jgi:hypothetical protein
MAGVAGFEPCAGGGVVPRRVRDAKDKDEDVLFFTKK